MAPRHRAAFLGAAIVMVLAFLLLRLVGGDSGEVPPAAPPAPLRPVDAVATPQAPAAAKPREKFASADPAPASAERLTAPDVLKVITNVPGATVTVRFRHTGGEPETEPAKVRCDAEGDATLPVPAHPGFLYQTTAEATAEGHLPELVRIPGSERELRIRFQPAPPEEPAAPTDPGLPVSGRVLFPDGRPVAGVDMEFPTDGGFTSATTDEKGEYEFRGCPRGPVTVQCPLSGEERKVEAGATDVDFTLRDHVVRFRFVDGKGRPFRWADWRYEVWSGGGKVDEGQGFGGEFTDLPVRVPAGGVLKVAPGAPGYPSAVTTIPVEGPPALHEVAIAIEKPAVPGTVAVRLRSDSDRPLGRVFLVVKNELGRVFHLYGIGRGELRLGVEGSLLVEGLPPGRWRIEANSQDSGYEAIARDFGLPASAEVSVEAGRTVPVDLAVPLGGKITLTVRGPDGAVVKPGEVRIRDERGEAIDASFWGRDEDGGGESPPAKAAPGYLEAPIPPGRYTLEVLRDGEVVGSKSVAVPYGETLATEIRLER